MIFKLDGSGGPGLLPFSENPPVIATSSGGEIGGGISFYTDTNILTLNIGLGSGKGFTDLSGPATAGHIHGNTTNLPPINFTENAGVINDLHSLVG